MSMMAMSDAGAGRIGGLPHPPVVGLELDGARERRAAKPDGKGGGGQANRGADERLPQGELRVAESSRPKTPKGRLVAEAPLSLIVSRTILCCSRLFLVSGGQYHHGPMPEDHEPHDVLARITDTPQLARAVPLLRPEVLHAVIAHYGLHDCGEFIALATPQQLSAVFDLDLWKAPRSGAVEQFDPARFLEWLEVLVDADPAIAADRLAQQDVALVVAGLSPSITVWDPAVFSSVVEPTGADPVGNAGRERGSSRRSWRISRRRATHGGVGRHRRGAGGAREAPLRDIPSRDARVPATLGFRPRAGRPRRSASRCGATAIRPVARARRAPGPPRVLAA